MQVLGSVQIVKMLLFRMRSGVDVFYFPNIRCFPLLSRIWNLGD